MGLFRWPLECSAVRLPQSGSGEVASGTIRSGPILDIGYNFFAIVLECRQCRPIVTLACTDCRLESAVSRFMQCRDARREPCTELRGCLPDPYGDEFMNRRSSVALGSARSDLRWVV